MKEWTLKKIVDYTSGSSGDGTHDRSIDIAFQDEEHITVDNNYCNHHVAGVFTLKHIMEQLDDIREARYFSDFCLEAARKIPGLRAVEGAQKWHATGLEIPATPAIVDREMAAGVQNKLTTFQPLKLKPKM